MEFLCKATVFSKLNPNSGYLQVEINEKIRDKTAFTLHHELYGFIGIPFGLLNAPGTCQRTMDVTLSLVKWQFALVYL